MPNGALRNEGRVCYYCRRVWRACFKSSMTLESFTAKIGDDAAVFDKFKGHLKTLLDAMTEAR
eukprot:4461330-Alexandrium_andersonii.AAC.1